MSQPRQQAEYNLKISQGLYNVMGGHFIEEVTENWRSNKTATQSLKHVCKRLKEEKDFSDKDIEECGIKLSLSYSIARTLFFEAFLGFEQAMMEHLHNKCKTLEEELLERSMEKENTKLVVENHSNDGDEDVGEYRNSHALMQIGKEVKDNYERRIELMDLCKNIWNMAEQLEDLSK
jgi:hypothetical protein|tara:strand:+ start:3509 stop:4039 length:531 start_codon:yes stop_codon:yes gene_type:complete